MPGWFEENISTVGTATLECSLPPGIVVGDGTLTIKPESDPRISFEVKKFEPADNYPGDLFTFLDAAVPVAENGYVTFRKRADVNPATLSFSTAEGQYTAENIIYFGGQFGSATQTVVPFFNDLTYRATKSEGQRFCVLPLCNFSTVYHRLEELATHPLAINKLIPVGIKFYIGAVPAYIQPLDPSGAKKEGVTAVLVTDILPGLQDNLESAREHFPFELLPALKFATGSTVFSPWLELRSSSGSLVSRFHVRVGKSLREHGHEFLDRSDVSDDSGLAHFLTKYMSLKQATRHWLSVVMNLCVSATPGTSSIDDNLSFVFRAFERLVDSHAVGRIDLFAQLSAPTAAEFSSLEATCRKNLSSLRAKARLEARLQDDRILERITSRVANVRTSDSDLGITMCELLKTTRLSDAEVLDREFIPKTFGGKTWAKVISELRQATFHEGYIEFQQRHEIHSTFSILRHLHDLLGRLIFLETGYEGIYRPALGRWPAEVPIRWVKPTMEATQLGFPAAEVI